MNEGIELDGRAVEGGLVGTVVSSMVGNIFDCAISPSMMHGSPATNRSRAGTFVAC